MELLEIIAGVRGIVQKPSCITDIDGEGPDPGCAVEDCPCLVFFEVDKPNKTGELRLEDVTPRAGNLKTG